MYYPSKVKHRLCFTRMVCLHCLESMPQNPKDSTLFPVGKEQYQLNPLLVELRAEPDCAMAPSFIPLEQTTQRFLGISTKVEKQACLTSI